MPSLPPGPVAFDYRTREAPGFQFLTIIDTHKLSGKIIYVLREVGTANSLFSLTVEQLKY